MDSIRCLKNDCSGGCATSVPDSREPEETGTQGDASNVDAVNPVAGQDSRPADCWFEVWIICTRGTGHSWRRMHSFRDRKSAEDLIAWHKEIDEKFPKGHYRYKIETVKE